MKHQNEPFLVDKDFSNLVKKAKRTSIIRNTLISIIVCIVLFYILYLLGSIVMQKKIDRENWIDGAWQQIIGANVEGPRKVYQNSPFSTSVTTHSIKHVGGVPVPWGSEEKVFTILGTSQSISKEMISGSGEIDSERIPLYFQGERLIEFFHPVIEYETRIDERPLLDEIDENKLVEFAFSFDKPYSIQKVQDAFSTHLAWYWVDTFSTNELDVMKGATIIGNNAIGFQHSDSLDFDPSSNFITSIEWLMENGGDYRKDAEKIYSNLTRLSEERFLPSDLKIIGVVVTGAPSELKIYDDVPFIKTAILGATVDRY